MKETPKELKRKIFDFLQIEDICILDINKDFQEIQKDLLIKKLIRLRFDFSLNIENISPDYFYYLVDVHAEFVNKVSSYLFKNIDDEKNEEELRERIYNRVFNRLTKDELIETMMCYSRKITPKKILIHGKDWNIGENRFQEYEDILQFAIAFIFTENQLNKIFKEFFTKKDICNILYNISEALSDDYSTINLDL